jgi:DNA-binding NarL/FixJ family response regulator
MKYINNEDMKSEVNIKIALVEDDNTVREGLQMLIQGTPGFECIATFACGERAIEELPGLKPDVVLMDINLPGISGIDCITQLKEHHPDIIFIMLTVFEDNEAIFRSLTAGASGYLLKQTPPAKLLEAIVDVYHGGSPMSSEIARKVVQSFQHPSTLFKPENSLTKREEEVLALLSKGFLYKEIADMSNISIDTVRSHIRHIYEKLQVNTRTEAILKYINHS